MRLVPAAVSSPGPTLVVPAPRNGQCCRYRPDYERSWPPLLRATQLRGSTGVVLGVSGRISPVAGALLVTASVGLGVGLHVPFVVAVFPWAGPSNRYRGTAYSDIAPPTST
jgi:hypothetical protein